MRKFKTVWLRSVIGLFFICSITLVYANTFAAEPAMKAEGVSFEVLNPEAEWIMPSEISLISPRLKDLSNKKIGLLYAGKSGGEFFLDALEVLLKKKYPSIKISRCLCLWGGRCRPGSLGQHNLDSKNGETG
jgi:hypothetical protein